MARKGMPSYQRYSPDQAELLPAHVKDVLGADHLCFLVHEVVESCDLSGFEKEEEDEGGQRPYDPRLMLKVWLYGFGVNVRTTRKLEQRIREDLGFRYLAGGAAPDHKTLSEFQRRHHAAIAELFTQVLLLLRRAGLARLGTVAIDSTRVKASASRDRVLREDWLEQELRKKVQRWQKELDDDPDREPGMRVGQEQVERVRQQLQRLRQSGESKLSTTDPEARFLRERGGRFVLGYTAEVAVSEDHFIVAQQVTQNKSDNDLWYPWSTKWNGAAARVRSGSWPTAAFSQMKICERWKRVTSNLSARSESGTGVEHRPGGRRSGTNGGERSEFATAQAEATHDGGPCLVQETQNTGRAGVWDIKRTARDAAVPAPRAVCGSGGMGARSDGPQSIPL